MKMQSDVLKLSNREEALVHIGGAFQWLQYPETKVKSELIEKILKETIEGFDEEYYVFECDPTIDSSETCVHIHCSIYGYQAPSAELRDGLKAVEEYLLYYFRVRTYFSIFTWHDSIGEDY